MDDIHPTFLVWVITCLLFCPWSGISPAQFAKVDACLPSVCLYTLEHAKFTQRLRGAALSCLVQVAYAVLTFYFLMPFVFMSIFTSDKRFFAQDATARLYHPAQYYWSKITVALPFNVIVAIVFHLVYYGMTGMRHGAESLAMACCICVLTGLIGMQVGKESGLRGAVGQAATASCVHATAVG